MDCRDVAASSIGLFVGERIVSIPPHEYHLVVAGLQRVYDRGVVLAFEGACDRALVGVHSYFMADCFAGIWLGGTR